MGIVSILTGRFELCGIHSVHRRKIHFQRCAEASWPHGVVVGLNVFDGDGQGGCHL